MPFLSSMRVGWWGLKSCSLGMGICSQGLACWALRAFDEKARQIAMARRAMDLIVRIPSGAKARIGFASSMYGLKPVPFKAQKSFAN
jgi:hypothetical protein